MTKLCALINFSIKMIYAENFNFVQNSDSTT